MHATKRLRFLARTVLAPAVLSAALSALAVAGDPTPGSLLFYPEFDGTAAGAITLITLTNVHPTQEVVTDWKYIEGDTCDEFNRFELLTPNDTFTVVSTVHNPSHERGYLYVYAVNDDLRAISFEWLIGTSTRIDGLDAFDYSIDPVAFHAFANEGELTDANNDGVRDLDGVEYSQTVDQLVVPRFLGQDPNLLHQSEVVLVNLSKGPNYTALVAFLLYNDNEEVFSAQHEFDCWVKTSLLDVSLAFSQEFLAGSTHDPEEVLGAPHIESGWFQVDGLWAVHGTETIEDPAILGFLVERSFAGHGAAELPFGVGMQANGGLVDYNL